MSLRILLVDDSSEDRKVLRALLGREAMFATYELEILEAQDGEEGIQRFKQHLPHLVVSDLLMPRMDGFALVKAIRETPDGESTPLLVVSGFFKDPRAVEQLKRQYNAEVIAKPVDPRELMGKTLVLLDQLKRAQPQVVDEWRRAPVKAAPASMPEPELDDEEVSEEPAPRSTAPDARRDVPAVDLSRPIRGTLAEHPLGWLIIHAAHLGVTGTLKLVRGKVRKLVFIIDGTPVFVDSNLRNETLGAYLVSHKVIDDNQLSQGLKHARSTGKKLGETLVKMGCVGEKTILSALAAQTRIKLARALIWQDGMFSFLPGGDFAKRIPKCPVDPVEVVLAGQKKMTRASDLGEILEPVMDRAPQLNEKGHHYREYVEKLFGAARLQRGICGLALNQIAEGDPDVPGLLVMVDVLRTCGMLQLAVPGAQAPFTAGAAQAPFTAGDQEPLTAGAAPVPMARITTVRKTVPRSADDAIPLSPGDPASDTAVGDDAAPIEPLPLNPAPAPAPREQTGKLRLEDLAPAPPLDGGSTDDIELFEPGEQVPPIYVEPEDSGVMQVPELELELEDPAMARPPEADQQDSRELLRERLLQTYLAIHGKNHYEVLGVEPEASAEEIAAAYQVMCDTFSNRRYKGVLQEDDEDKLIELDLIIEQAHAVLSDPEQRRGHDETLARMRAEVEPRTDAYGAELYYQEGHALLKQQDIEGAVAAFRRAVQENPDQSDHHAYLGWAMFLSRGRGVAGATAARPHLEQALRVSPEAVKPLELAGWVERDAGHDATALDYLSRALHLGPPRLDLFEAVKGLLTRMERWRDLEHEYRRIIFRLRTKEPMQTLVFWIELAYLYRNKLEEPDSAKLALEVAAKLAPGDPRVKAALNASGSFKAQQWEQVLEGYRRQLLAEPDNVEPLHDLVQLHLRDDRHDAAFVVACLLEHHGSATPEELQLCHELAPGRLIRLTRPPTAEELVRIRHPDDLLSVENLMAALAHVMSIVMPVGLEQHGTVRPLEQDALPARFVETVRYVEQQLGRNLPPLCVADSLALEMLPVPGDQPRVLLGPQLLKSEDQVAVAFATARLLTSILPGRIHILGRRGAELKVAVLATLAYCRPTMPPPDPDGAIGRFREALESRGQPREELSQLVGELLARDSKINLSQWIRALYCTAARVGLLFCADIRPALDGLRHEPHTIRDLTVFALDQAYTGLRRELGISVTV